MDCFLEKNKNKLKRGRGWSINNSSLARTRPSQNGMPENGANLPKYLLNYKIRSNNLDTHKVHDLSIVTIRREAPE